MFYFILFHFISFPWDFFVSVCIMQLIRAKRWSPPNNSLATTRGPPNGTRVAPVPLVLEIRAAVFAEVSTRVANSECVQHGRRLTGGVASSWRSAIASSRAFNRSQSSISVAQQWAHSLLLGVLIQKSDRNGSDENLRFWFDIVSRRCVQETWRGLHGSCR